MNLFLPSFPFLYPLNTFFLGIEMEHWAKLVNKILWVTAKSIIMKQCVKNLIKVLTCSVPKEKEWLAKEVLDTLKFFLWIL